MTVKMNGRKKKALAVLAAAGLAGAAWVSMDGLYGAEMATSPQRQMGITTGDFEIQLLPGGTGTASTGVTAAPGDVVTDYFSLRNISEGVAIGKVDVTATRTGSIFAGATPVTISADACLTPWTAGQCPGGAIPLLTGANSSTGSLSRTIPAGETLYLRARATAPDNMGNEYQGRSGRVNYMFVATQALEDNLPRPEKG